MTPPSAWLGSAELQQRREALSLWQTPEVFARAIKDLDAHVLGYQKFNDTELGFFTDAYTLGLFATLIAAEEVRISERRVQFPDGEVRMSGKTLEVEIVEAGMPNRRRGLEYQPGAPMMKGDPIEDSDKEFDEVSNAVKEAIEKKIAKHYRPPPVLVVYVNLGRPKYGYHVDEIQAEVRAIKHFYSPQFTDLYLIWGKRLF